MLDKNKVMSAFNDVRSKFGDFRKEFTSSCHPKINDIYDNYEQCLDTLLEHITNTKNSISDRRMMSDWFLEDVIKLMSINTILDTTGYSPDFIGSITKLNFYEDMLWIYPSKTDESAIKIKMDTVSWKDLPTKIDNTAVIHTTCILINMYIYMLIVKNVSTQYLNSATQSIKSAISKMSSNPNILDNKKIATKMIRNLLNNIFIVCDKDDK